MPTYSGHRGVAGWVLANSADVVGYWPLSDAAASGGIHDVVSKQTGTYGSGMTTRTVDGETMANFDAAATDDSTVGDFAALDNVVAGFAVVEFDDLATINRMMVARDDEDGGQRSFQFKYQQSTGFLRFTKIGGVGGNQSCNGTTTIQTGQRYTVGFAIYGGNCHVYLNGEDDGSASMNALAASASELEFGFRGNSVSPVRLNGALGSVVLLDTADATTIPALHDAWETGYWVSGGRAAVNTWVAASPGKVLAYYQGDDCASAATMTDDGPHGYDGTWDTTADNSTVAMSTGDTGAEILAGGAVGADTDPGGGEVADPGASEFDAVIGAWFVQEMLDDDTGVQCWLSRDDLSTQRSFGLRRTGGNTQLRINGSTNVLAVTNAVARTRDADGETTLGFIRDTNWYLYSNGAQVDSDVGAVLDAESLGLTVGRYDGTTEYAINGHMAEVVVLRSPAVKEDLATLHNAWVATDSSPPLRPGRNMRHLIVR